jgi:hypothetical protein
MREISAVAVGVLLTILAAFPVRTEALLRASLVWERAFDQEIRAAGIDEERFNATGDIASSLKWVLLADRKVYLLDGEGTVLPGVVWGYSYDQNIAPNGRYFSLTQSADCVVYDYSLYDWDGKRRLEFQQEGLKFLDVRDDGSSAMPLIWYGEDVFGLQRVTGVKFFSKNGILQNTYTFPQGRRRPSGPVTSISDGFYALYVTSSSGQEIYVFDARGRLFWQKALEKEPTVSEEEMLRANPYLIPRFGVGVSSNGEVIAVRGPYPGRDSLEFLAFDRSGTLQVRFLLGPRLLPEKVRVCGRLAYVSTSRGRGNPALFLSYDLGDMRPRFLHSVGDARLGRFDVSLEEGLIALALSLNDGTCLVRILDLNGLQRMDLPLSVRPGDSPWFRLLRGALVVAEGNTLKLYSLKEETEKQKE